jgi:para-nitrobenzyl esterase
MKKLLLAVILALSVQGSWAQFVQYCGTPRYDTEVFSTVTITSDVIFGSNNVAGGGPIDLTMDIYEPTGDTVSIRPLIIFVHGGSFIGGTKNDPDVTALCNHFAKRGYVCASINYRTGFAVFPPNAGEAKRAVYRSVHDMKAAVRYFRKDAATTNTYKIDPLLIFGGGSSAGAFTSLHLAYMDEPSELPAEIDTLLMGGMEGNSGNPGYSSEINAVINLCGAVGDKTWMHPGDEPVVSMHGTIDGTVPYATDIIVFLGIVPLMQVDGSYSISEYADSIGLLNSMYTFYGQDHVPYASNTAYMDTTVRFVSNFLYSYMGCTPTDPNPLPNTFSIGINEVANNSFRVFPNPSHGNIQFSENLNEFKVFDVNGRMVFHSNENANRIVLELEPGVYFYSANEKRFNGKLVVVE